MLLLEGKLKWFGVKFRKEMKKTELAASGMIREADDFCVRVLLFLLCFKAKDLERIDMDFFRSSVKEYADDEAVLDVLYYLQEKNILDYNYERAEIADCKGINMDKIVNLIGNISNNISSMSGGEYKEPEAAEEQREFEKIYRVGSRNTNHPGFAAAPEESGKNEEFKADKAHEANEEDEKIEEVGEFEEIEETEEIGEIEKTEKTEEIEESEEKAVEFEKIEFEKEEQNIFHTDLGASLELKTEEMNIMVTFDMVCDELESNVDFGNLYNKIQHKLKAIINPSELEILYNLYVKMESGLLLKIAEYCGETAENPLKVVNYFEKTALNLSNGGIRTLEQYLKHLENARKTREYEIKIKKIFGLRDTKKFTSRERQYIRTWALEYKFSDEMIIEGYTKALNKGKATIPYINAIYLGWYEKGFTNVDEVRNEFNSNSGKSSGTKQKSQPDFDSEQFFEKLVRKSMKF